MLEQARALRNRMTGIRRDIHRHPELGFDVPRTAALAAEALTALGARVRTGVGRTGVVADLGPASGPVVAMRADLDALPIQEATGADYASGVPGRMHACGHDSHVACVIGAATLLAGLDLPATVRFLFQPSEETEDEEGQGGALRMLQDGAMEGVAAVLGIHVDGEVPTGRFGLEQGWVNASADSFRAWIKGTGGHGAHPDRGTDPIFMASQVLPAIYAIPSRRIDPLRPCVVSLGVIRAGQAPNVIPAEVYLEGTLRSFDPAVRDQLDAALEQALGVARALGGDYRLEIVRGCPPLRNDPALGDRVAAVATALLGPDALAEPVQSMGADDFAYLAERAPGFMIRLGTRVPGGPARKLHTPDFDLDEEALPLGAALLAESALALAREVRA
jgi:amidohydrolase